MTHHFRSALLGAVLLPVVLLPGACAVGPDFERPAAPVGADYTPTPLPPVTAAAAVHGGEAQHFALGKDVPFDWWKQFQSPALDALVEQAFKANPTIEAAQAALQQAQENVSAQRGFFFPNVTVGYNGIRQQLSGNTANSGEPGYQGNGREITQRYPAQPVTYTFHTANLTVGFAPDVFGGNRRAVESLQAQAEGQRFALEATYITLASNVVAAALQEASVRAQIAATKEIIRANEKSLEILKNQFRLGSVIGIDVAAQEAALEQARALLPPLEKQYEQTRDLLRALVGNLPNQDVPQTFQIDAIHLPEEPPVSLPSALIEQRPDVRAAEEQVHAASADVGVAISNMLPQFTLTAAGGGGATLLGQLFSTGGPFWNVGWGVTQPLFDGLTLLHKRRAADQALIQAAAQYRSTVITAFQNVADTLHALVSDAKALEAASNAEKAAAHSLDITRRQLELGQVNYLALLIAQQVYQQAALALVQAQATRFGDTVSLFQALGGGWWNRTAAAPTPAKPS